MVTTDLLKNNGIKSALIVDDGYDLEPRLSDLGATNSDWATFFDDLMPEDHELLKKAYPDYDLGKDYSGDELFLRTVWDLREKLSSEAIEHIFRTYEHNQSVVTSVLENAENSLKSFGLTVKKAGRNFKDAATSADLVLIDLYLGAQHDPEDMMLSINGLKEAVSKRSDGPPAIILMSSHPGISAKRGQFRDGAGVFASSFRAVKKSELGEDGCLNRLLFELAQYKTDSLKLHRFLKTWSQGVMRSVEETATNMRRLDLEDIRQLQDLLLDDEQESRGSYMLDLVDRLLLHEVESDTATIAAANKLSSMESEGHPPNTVTDSKDNLRLVGKTLYVHRNRRKLDSPDGYPVSFGDIIALKRGAKPPSNSIFSGARNSVFIVMTPACDLVRDPPKAKRVLLLEGECKPVDVVAYTPPSPSDNLPRTIVLEHGQEKVGVEWQPKKLATITKTVMENLLAKDEIFLAGRLRSEFALELQQAMLSGAGRVGVMAPMPSNYSITTNVYYPDKGDNLVKIDVKLQGVCVVGRSSNRKTVRIGFDSSQRAVFIKELKAVISKVHGQSRDKIKQSISVESVDAFFSKGFVFDIKKASNKHEVCKLDLQSGNCKVGSIVYEADADDRIKDPGQRRAAGVIFEIFENIQK